MPARLLAGGVVVAALLCPLLVRDQYVLHVLIMWGIYAVLTLGLNVINGFAGQLSIGQGAFYGIGGYAAAILTARVGWSFWLATPLAALLAAAVGVLVSLPVLRVRGIYLGMATFGFADVAEEAIVIEQAFSSFDDYWRPFLAGVGPGGAYVASLAKERSGALEERLRRRWPEGPFALRARAWCVKGTT